MAARARRDTGRGYSIPRGVLRAIDDDDLNRALVCFQFEPELFRYRGKDGWNRAGQLFPPLNSRGFTSQRERPWRFRVRSLDLDAGRPSSSPSHAASPRYLSQNPGDETAIEY